MTHPDKTLDEAKTIIYCGLCRDLRAKIEEMKVESAGIVVLKEYYLAVGRNRALSDVLKLLGSE